MQEHSTRDSPGPVDEDPAFERRAWRVQKAGRCLAVLLVLAALAGLFGGGGLAHDAVSDAAGTIRVEYDRFLRSDAPFDLTIVLHDPPRQEQGRVALWMEDSLPEVFQVEGVSPAPRSEAVRDGKLIYDLAIDGSAPALVRLRLEAKKIGWSTSRLGIVGGGAVEFRQFIYP